MNSTYSCGSGKFLWQNPCRLVCAIGIHLLLLFSPLLHGHAEDFTAVAFDGIDDFVQISSPPVLGTNFTEEAWILPKPTDNRFHGIMGIPGNQTSDRAPGIWLVNQTAIHAGFGDGSDWNSLSSKAGVIELDVWNHIAATYDGVHYRIFANGQEVVSVPISKIPLQKPVVRIGRVDNYFTGAIREVRLWKRALTPEEIRRQMTSELTGDEEGLISCFHFNEGTGAQANNSAASASESHATLLNGASWINSSAPIAPAALAASRPPEPPRFIESFLPADDNAAPDAFIEIILRTPASQVNRSSIRLTYDQANLVPKITRNNKGALVMRHEFGKLLEPGSTHKVELAFCDLNTPPQTNTFSYSFSINPHILLSK